VEIIRPIFRAYVEAHPGETAHLRQLETLLANHPPERWIDRKNFVGHVTASAFVVNPQIRHVLLIKHKFLKRWLQPGGHIEAGDGTPLAAAKREVAEEIGLPPDQLTLVATTADVHLPLDIDTHFIPKNPQKGEDEHYHHDFQYLFAANGKSTLRANSDELCGFRWIPIHELARDVAFARVANKLCDALG
jgi:8-oxo-dGTP pyrophosphatase MutT (NUDIX family)